MKLEDILFFLGMRRITVAYSHMLRGWNQRMFCTFRKSKIAL